MDGSEQKVLWGDLNHWGKFPQINLVFGIELSKLEFFP